MSRYKLLFGAVLLLLMVGVIGAWGVNAEAASTADDHCELSDVSFHPAASLQDPETAGVALVVRTPPTNECVAVINVTIAAMSDEAYVVGAAGADAIRDGTATTTFEVEPGNMHEVSVEFGANDPGEYNIEADIMLRPEGETQSVAEISGLRTIVEIGDEHEQSEEDDSDNLETVLLGLVAGAIILAVAFLLVHRRDKN